MTLEERGMVKKAHRTFKSSENSFLILVAIKYEKFGMKEKHLHLL